MSIISDDERAEIEAILDQPLCCAARKFNQMLRRGHISDERRLQAEVFIHAGCEEIQILERFYLDYGLRRDHDRRRREEPTTQETDRKAWRRHFSNLIARLRPAPKKNGSASEAAPWP